MVAGADALEFGGKFQWEVLGEREDGDEVVIGSRGPARELREKKVFGGCSLEVYVWLDRQAMAAVRAAQVSFFLPTQTI